MQVPRKIEVDVERNDDNDDSDNNDNRYIKNNDKPLDFHRSCTSDFLTFSQSHKVHASHETRGIFCAIPTASKLIPVIDGVAGVRARQ